MNIVTKMLSAGVGLTMSAGIALAEPAIIFDLGGKFDKSFNESAFTGAQRWADETGGSFREIELQNEAQREQALRRFAEAGANPIVMAGFAFADSLGKVAPDYPDTKFAVIDVNWLSLPNVRGIGFNEHEGSYLVGMLAAQASKSGTVGFVGGMDIPLIRRFGCGYAQGVMAVNPNATVIANMTGTTNEAWNNPTKGAELTKAQIDGGADVVYQAAGGTGIGVLQAAADAGIMGIGVDSNQNWMHPGTMLTSMLKRLDLTIFEQAQNVAKGSFESGINILGLSEGMLGYATEDGMVTSEMAAAADAAAADIASGALVVADWSQE